MDKLDPLLGLDETYFDTQVQVLIDYYRQRKDYRKWGEGTFYTRTEPTEC